MPKLEYEEIDVPYEKHMIGYVEKEEPPKQKESLGLSKLDVEDRKDQRRHIHNSTISKAGIWIIVGLLVGILALSLIERYRYGEAGHIETFIDLGKSLIMLIAGYLFAKHSN